MSIHRLKKPLMLSLLLVGVVPIAKAPAQAPINRRLEVHGGESGFVVYGFRAEVGSKGRFQLATGMSADAVRSQLGSVEWASYSENLDSEPPRATAQRTIYVNTHEAVEVLLNEPDGVVWQVTYEVAPARYSRDNLERRFRQIYGKETKVRSSASSVQAESRAKGGQRMNISASLMSPQRPTEWNIRYVLIDPSLKPTPEDSKKKKDGETPSGGEEVIEIETEGEASPNAQDSM